MGIVERFGAYAEAFEQAYASDDWSVLEQYFTEDAVYNFIAAPPLGGRHEGRATILRDFQSAVNGFDRRFASRRIELIEGPLEKNGDVWMKWAAIYTLDGAPECRMEGEERAVFGGDRISLLEDSVTDAEGQRLGAYMEAHGDKLKLV
jgi:ketosteroid isomerase-like protein